MLHSTHTHYFILAHAKRRKESEKKKQQLLTTHLLTRLSSAKDKVVLESAYNANPKPDKAARLDIVKRVSLNEKEVQVRAPMPRIRV